MTDKPVLTSNKVCPECGAKLASLDLHGHYLSHYPDYLDPQKSSAIALKRAKQLLNGGVSPEEFAKAHHTED